MTDFVEQIGKRFEFHRTGFSPEHVDAASNALDELYKIFKTPPVPRRQIHDGISPIVVTAGTWQAQHGELWNLLVPSGGSAATIQGEVIRISGRISDEMYRNGGANWDADYNKMADAFLEHVRGGKPLAPKNLAEAAAIVAVMKRKDGDGDTERMAQLAVEWVLQNREPCKLLPPSYKR